MCWTWFVVILVTHTNTLFPARGNSPKKRQTTPQALTSKARQGQENQAFRTAKRGGKMRRQRPKWGGTPLRWGWQRGNGTQLKTPVRKRIGKSRQLDRDRPGGGGPVKKGGKKSLEKRRDHDPKISREESTKHAIGKNFQLNRQETGERS